VPNPESWVKAAMQTRSTTNGTIRGTAGAGSRGSAGTQNEDQGNLPVAGEGQQGIIQRGGRGREGSHRKESRGGNVNPFEPSVGSLTACKAGLGAMKKTTPGSLRGQKMGGE